MYLEESKDYAIIILNEETRETKGVNYGVVNKEHDLIEAMCQAKFIAYELLEDLQKKLDKINNSKAKLTVVKG